MEQEYNKEIELFEEEPWAEILNKYGSLYKKDAVDFLSASNHRIAQQATEKILKLIDFKFDEDAEQDNSGAYEYFERQRIHKKVLTFLNSLQDNNK